MGDRVWGGERWGLLFFGEQAGEAARGLRGGVALLGGLGCGRIKDHVWPSLFLQHGNAHVQGRCGCGSKFGEFWASA